MGPSYEDEHDRRNWGLLLTPGFLIGLCLLLLNDFALKEQFHNPLTGKVSDYAGLFVFPLFWVALFPRSRTLVYAATAVLFVFWKSGYSQPLIDSFNSLSLFSIARVVDHTDLVALSVLPFSYLYARRCSVSARPRAVLYFIALVSVFAFAATSFRSLTQYDQAYEFQFSKHELMERMSHLAKNRVTPAFWEGNYEEFEVRFDSCTGSAKITVREDQGKTVVVLKEIEYRCPSGEEKSKMQKYFETEFIEKLKEPPTERSRQFIDVWGVENRTSESPRATPRNSPRKPFSSER